MGSTFIARCAGRYAASKATVRGPQMHKRGIADHNQLTGVLHRDRFQQECIHQAENRGVRADTQRQRSYNDEHERGRSPKYSQRITQIFQQDFPRRPPNTSKMARSD